MIPAAENILSYLSKNPDVIRCDIAGSLRRWKETAKDIDLLASALPVKHDSVMEYFTSLPSVEAVVAKGKAKSSIRLENGIIAELRIVEDSQFPYALHHLTGSSEHNIALRQYAGKMKLNMNEYGLFDQEGNNIGCKDEQDIFQQLKLEYIPPELRENRGEIEAASSGELPILITQSDIRGMIHVHSNYSDGISTISELAEACRAQGFSYLVISDHSRSAAYAGGLSVERIHQQISEIDQINKSFSDFRILKSIESDILSDGRLDYEEDVLKLFDLVIASIHSRLNMSQSEATDRIIKAMENPFLTILGHPTGRLLLAREGYPVDMKAVIEAAATLNVALELNSNPHRLDTDWRYLKQAKEQGVKISINPDAHRIEGFQDIRYGIGIARKGWLSSGDVLNCMTSEDIIRFARNRRN
ncbi:MAG: histidinol-phosphatase [Calditrichaeota bacterium]|nr:MAG: histidinol-phosphatase [Calditrichota bacterium]